MLDEFHLVLRLAAAAAGFVDPNTLETGRQRLDRLEHRDDLRVFLGRHLARNDDAEMADVLVQQADDDLAA